MMEWERGGGKWQQVVKEVCERGEGRKVHKSKRKS